MVIAPHEAMRDALNDVYPGAEEADADAVLDKLEDHGYRLTLTREAQRRGEAA